jgi:uncharacterized protein
MRMFLGAIPTVALLIASNIFMTFAWYAHLRNLSDRPWYIAALISWGIALFEYLLQVPANRLGWRSLSLAQHAAASQLELSVGRALPDGCRLLHV